MSDRPVKRALLSVSDKTGLIDFARALHGMGVEMLSTGGTAKALRDAGLPVIFIAFLVGVCVIATGLTFLETIANPYTTVLGDRRYAATRINLAQSANGVGWIFGPIIGSVYFYSTNAAGESTSPSGSLPKRPCNAARRAVAAGARHRER